MWYQIFGETGNKAILYAPHNDIDYCFKIKTNRFEFSKAKLSPSQISNTHVMAEIERQSAGHIINSFLQPKSGASFTAND